MNPSELERAEDAECEAQRAAAGRRRVEEAVGRLEARDAVSGAHSAGEPEPGAWPTPGQWIARWDQLSPGQRFEWAERIIEDSQRASRCFVMNHENHIAHLEHALAERRELLREANIAKNAAFEALTEGGA